MVILLQGRAKLFDLKTDSALLLTSIFMMGIYV